ncbi:UNVERIFIED_CONTAM: hypothetical protein Scaly_2944700 [Sesamum calycinum]|uniref:DUF8040 domain-containing protein n=1 Tax=Sesamum calycinum TaxID=2727403 RepID=A0AAW2KWE5_9LAMI
MSRNAFGRLRLILQNQELVNDAKPILVSEQVEMFLSVLAHHKRNCIVKYDFIRSARKEFLGALDDTYIDVRIPAKNRAHYRTRKGLVAVNVLCELVGEADNNTEYLGTIDSNPIRNTCNGFCIGYLGVLEQMLSKQLTGYGLKSDPHMSSKIHV